MVITIRFAASIVVFGAFVGCGTIEQNAWTFGVDPADATEISRLIHATHPNCKIYRFDKHPEWGGITADTDCKTFLARKTHGRWHLVDTEFITVV
jgi:hypothetical protein